MKVGTTVLVKKGVFVLRQVDASLRTLGRISHSEHTQIFKLTLDFIPHLILILILILDLILIPPLITSLASIS